MSKINVLVTGVGAIIGYGIIRSLRNSKYDVNIVGIDIYHDAVGGNWCDVFEQGILANDEKFISFILDLIKKHSIDLVIPGIEQDLSSFVDNLEVLEKSGANFVINNLEMYPLLTDKLKTNDLLVENNINAIPTISDENATYDEVKKAFGIPFIIKDRLSYASKGVVKAHNEQDFNYWTEKFSGNCIFQKLMQTDGCEYTVSVFGISDGLSKNMIILKRSLSGEGATAKAEVVQDEVISSYVKELVEVIKPVGPTNIQIVKNNDSCYLLEVNPRISSSTSIREKFGINESEMCIEYYLLKKDIEDKEIRSGKVTRYIEDFVIYDRDHS